MKNIYKIFILVVLIILILGIFGFGMKTVKAVDTKTISQTTEQAEETNNNKGIGMIAAALSTGLACLGAGIAVALVASSAVGAISENPSLLGKTIIFAGLAEGIAIYGLIISIMILNKI